MTLPGRTTTDAVRKIITVDPTVDDDTLSIYIDMANEVVTDACAVDPAYTADRLEKIERWLSCHFYCVYDPQTKSEGVSGVSASYEGNTGLLLFASRYGQAAMALDTQGWLSTMSKLMEQGKRRRKLGVIWLGQKRPQIDTGYLPFPSPQLDQVDGGTGDYLNP